MEIIIEAQPQGWRRIFRWLPYFTGSNLRILLGIKTIDGGEIRFHYLSRLDLVTSDRSRRQISHDERITSRTRDSIRSEISAFIATPGYYELGITLNDKGRERFEPIMGFQAHSKDIAQLNLAITLFSLLAGGIIGWVLGRI